MDHKQCIIDIYQFNGTFKLLLASALLTTLTSTADNGEWTNPLSSEYMK